jgi:hypothetical protein
MPLSLHNYSQSLERKRYAALERWADALEAIHSTVGGKVGKTRLDEAMMGGGMIPPEFNLSQW